MVLANPLYKCRVGQDCIYTLYMTVYLVISLPKIACMYGSGQSFIYVVFLAQISFDRL